MYFWGRKINLPGISSAKRSRSRPNSVYVDRSRGDNVQRILGAIGPSLEKSGLGRVPQSQSFFCVVIQTTFRQLRNGRFSPNLVTKRSSVSRFGIICPQNLKSKIGQTSTSLTAGYRSWDALQRDTVYSTL